jgi:hypothetical protein
MRREIVHKCNNICVIYRATSDLKTVSCRFVNNESNEENPTSLSPSVIGKKIEKTKVKKNYISGIFRDKSEQLCRSFLNCSSQRSRKSLSRMAVEKRIIILQFQKW